MALATLSLAVASVYQYLTMKQQAAATGAQLKTMQDQSELIKGQLSVMERQTKTMEGQSTTLSDSLVETRKAVKAAETQARASIVQAQTAQISAKAAEKSLELATLSMIIGNRPHISIAEIKPPSLAVGQPTVIDIVWANDGNSSADIVGDNIIFFITSTVSGGFVCPSLDIGAFQSKSIILADLAPHSRHTQRLSISSFTIEQIDDVKARRKYFGLCGRIIYHTSISSFSLDQIGVGENLFFGFCSYYDPVEKTYLDCK